MDLKRAGLLTGVVTLAIGMLGVMFVSPANAAQCTATDAQIHTAVSGLNQEARTKWPETYGAIWTTRNGPRNGVFAGFSQNAKDNVSQLADGFICPELLVAVNLNFSEQQMTAYTNLILRDRNRAQRGQLPLGHATNGGWTISTSVIHAVIEIRMPLITKRIRSAFENRYGADDVRVMDGNPYDGYEGVTIQLVQTGYFGDDPESGRMWKRNLKQLNRNLHRTQVRLRIARVKGTPAQVHTLRKRIVVQQQRKRALRRKMLGLPWPVRS